MNNDVEVEGRPRPLSTGLWTLFSWLRRDDKSVSSESLSSAGSDRTVASFAFLTPKNYRVATAPLVLPPPGPPTDSYKKRVHDRNLRRHNDRDLTLHRKYGLYKSEGTCSYDAFSLPPVRRVNSESVNRWDRERRATSECYHRRLAHVPGKRRAPLPPVSATSASLSPTLKRSRKRPAPQPPIKHSERNKENLNSNASTSAILMSSNKYDDKPKQRNNDVKMDYKSEKCCKKETSGKDSKIKSEKSFLKQIFDNKKRNSSIDTASVKMLPSISELDKQAAEIIKTCKLRALEQNNNATFKNFIPQSSNQVESWFCIRCLRKYDSSVVTCVHCLPDQNKVKDDKGAVFMVSKASDSYTQTEKELSKIAQSNKAEDKQKLKDMLKEMKDSLPKRPKHDSNNKMETKPDVRPGNSGRNVCLTETPTLRVGSTQQDEKRTHLISKLVASNDSTRKTCSTNLQTALVAHVISTYKNNVDNHLNLADRIMNTNNSVAQAKEADDAQAKEANVAQAKKPNVAQAKEANVAQAKEANVALAKEANVAQAKEVNVAKAKEGNVALAKEANVTQAKEANVAKAKKSNNAQAKEANVAQAKEAHVTQAKAADIQVKSKKSEHEFQRSMIEPKQSLHTPLKISSLLNPIYVPKSPGNNEPKLTKKLQPVPVIDKELAKTYVANRALSKPPSDQTTTDAQAVPSTSQINGLPQHRIEDKSKEIYIKEEPSSSQKLESKLTIHEDEKIIENNSKLPTSVKEQKTQNSTHLRDNHQDQHSRRRDLINQLEQSIAKGDERAAADAAAKLAQLRLSCSVLSFTSQILSRPSTSSDNNVDVKVDNVELSQNKITKYNEPLQKTEVANAKKTSPPRNLVTTSVVLAPNKLTTSPVFKSDTPKNTPLQKDIQNEKVNLPKKAAEIHKEVIPNKNNNNTITIAVLVEDREATRGPVQLRINRQALMRDLRREAETTLGLAANLQRWIVGRVLCVDDNTQVASLAGSDFSAPFYLCVVESETKAEAVLNKNQDTNHKPGGVYTELVQLEQQALVPNAENFECGVCMEEYLPGQGVVLRECVHIFCKECLSDVVRHCEEPDIPCPAMGCRRMLQEREIRALLPRDDYERWLARGLAAAESGTRNAFHCRTRDCKGWALCEPGVTRFPCPVCKRINCVPCQTIHDNETCEQHQKKAIDKNINVNEKDDGTRTLLNSLIRKGEALECPECSAIITKKWGCDWVKCSACKTEICWVTRGRRWGPAGKGDTSAGCRCGVDGKRCHPSCGYCH